MARTLRPDEPGWTDHVLNHGNARNSLALSQEYRGAW